MVRFWVCFKDKSRKMPGRLDGNMIKRGVWRASQGFGKRNCLLLRCGISAKNTVLDIIVWLKMVIKYVNDVLLEYGWLHKYQG